jgi:hypothetical protein
VIATVLFALLVALTGSLVLFLGSTAQAAARHHRPVASKPKVPPVLGELIASDAWVGDNFGWSVSVSGSTAVVGAPYANSPAGSYTGAAYIYTDVGGVWTQQALLTASDAVTGGDFGQSVFISGKTVVVGAPGQDFTNGEAYVFTESDSGVWAQQGLPLAPDDGGCCDKFGYSVSTSGTTVVVGADKAYINDVKTGAVYVFANSGGTWNKIQTLTADDSNPGDMFGWSMALSGSTLVVSAVTHGGTGAIYVFTHSTTWTQRAELVGSQATDNDYFGDKVAISGKRIVAGGPGYNQTTGAAWIFTGSGAKWKQEAMLQAHDGQQNACFGWAVGISGSTVLVGAEQTAAGSGAAYVFKAKGSKWTEISDLSSTDGGSTPEFGYSASLSGKTALIGADGSDAGSGSAYLYKL